MLVLVVSVMLNSMFIWLLLVVVILLCMCSDIGVLVSIIVYLCIDDNVGLIGLIDYGLMFCNVVVSMLSVV